MANEIRVGASLQFSKDGSSDTFSLTDSVTMSGSQYNKKTQSIGTSEENLVKGDISTIGFVLVRNLDDTNFVTLMASTGVDAIKLLAGESAGPMRWAAAQVIAKADTATCIVEYLMIEA